MKQFSVLFLFWVVVANVVVSCGSKNDDQLAKAQKCLNNAQTPTDANACSEILGSLTGDRANRIRCGIVVLQAGLTQDRIINSLAAIDATGADPILEVGTGLAIKDLNGVAEGYTATEVAAAKNAQTICNQTSSKGLQLVANLIVLGTEAEESTQTLGGDVTDPTSVATHLGNLSDSDAGDFAISTFQIYCVPTFTDTKICTSLQAAGADSSSPDTTIGASLKTCLAANNCH